MDLTRPLVICIVLLCKSYEANVSNAKKACCEVKRTDQNDSTCICLTGCNDNPSMFRYSYPSTCITSCTVLQADRSTAIWCLNGGSCTKESNPFRCICSSGYTGDTCQTNISKCSQGLCKNGGTCKSTTSSRYEFQCICATGYSGEYCETNIDDCAKNPCMNGGTCIDGINTFKCRCPAGYSGKDCATNIDDCAKNPCMNGGTCTDGINTFKCRCPAGYSGKDCATNVNECESTPCQNGGTCTDEVNNFTCICIDGFSGETCDAIIIPASTSHSVNVRTTASEILSTKEHTLVTTPAITASFVHVRTSSSGIPLTKEHTSYKPTSYTIEYSTSDDTSTLGITTPTDSVKFDKSTGKGGGFPVAAAVAIPLLVLTVAIAVIAVIVFHIRKSKKRAYYENNPTNISKQDDTANVPTGASNTLPHRVVGDPVGSMSNHMYGINMSNNMEAMNARGTINTSAKFANLEDNDTAYARIDECIVNSGQDDDAMDSTYNKIDECMRTTNQTPNDNNDLIKVIELFKPIESTGTEYSALFRRNENIQEYTTLTAQESNIPATEDTSIKLKRTSKENQTAKELNRPDDETGQYFILEKQNSGVKTNVKEDGTDLNENCQDDQEQLGAYAILEKESIATSARHIYTNDSSNIPMHGEEETHSGTCPDYFKLEKPENVKESGTPLNKNCQVDQEQFGTYFILEKGSVSTPESLAENNYSQNAEEETHTDTCPDYFKLENPELHADPATAMSQNDPSNVSSTHDKGINGKTVPDYFMLEDVALGPGKTTDWSQSVTHQPGIATSARHVFKTDSSNTSMHGQDETHSDTGPDYFKLEKSRLPAEPSTAMSQNNPSNVNSWPTLDVGIDGEPVSDYFVLENVTLTKGTSTDSQSVTHHPETASKNIEDDDHGTIKPSPEYFVLEKLPLKA